MLTRIFIAVFLLLCSGYASQAQFKVLSQGGSGMLPEDFIKEIVTAGTTISNIEQGYFPSSAGTYQYATIAQFPSRGSVLSTGTVTKIPGSPSIFMADNNPNPATGPNYATYKAKLAALGGSSHHNVQYIAFDISTTCDELGIQYLFGSEEYPEWVHSSYNDAFAIFIDGGPDPNNPLPPPAPPGSFQNYNFKNLTLVPGTTTPIKINNVNDNHPNHPPLPPPGPTNPIYYIPQSGVSPTPEIAFDGRTVPLVATTAVIPNENYRIIVIIGDVGDPWWDSGVLLCVRGTGCLDINEDPCGISSVPSVVNSCNSSTNKYSVSGTLNYSSSFNVTIPMDLVIQYDGVDLLTSQYTINSFGSGFANVTVNDLESDGGIHRLTYRLNDPLASGEKPCRRSFIYYAPKKCRACSLTNLTVNNSTFTSPKYTINTSQCDPTTNTFTLSGTVSYTDAPSKGQLIVTNGYQYERYNAPFAAGSTNFTIKGLKSNGAEYELKAYFTESPTCLRTLIYISPPPCFTPTTNTDCITSFVPARETTYVVSAWVKEAVIPSTYTYSQAGVKIEFLDNATPTPNVISGGGTYYASGKIIDGWQKIESSFAVPTGAYKIRVTLYSTTSQDALYDDIRIFPVGGNMKSYAYDPINLRLLAELDENNYATQYEYDSEGNLVRVKKETERGVVTLKENTTRLPERVH